MDYPSLEQFFTPVDEGYVALVGHAAYAFVYLEWQVVHLGEKIAPGFIYKVVKLTAGGMAQAFASKTTEFAGDPTLRAELIDVATKFSPLVARRNHLLHAHPATIRGEQRLNYWDKTMTFAWEPDDVVAFTHEVEALSREGNRLYFDLRMPR